MNHIFFFLNDTKLANYADDTSVYASHVDTHNLIKLLETETFVVLEWFRNNEMKSNDDKCHLLVANHSGQSLNLENNMIQSSDSVKLLGVIIDKQLNFKEHVSKLIKKGNQKLHALARVSRYLNQSKLKILMKSFIQSQFNNCPLLWMLHNRTLKNKTDRLHERALSIVYMDDIGPDRSFNDLLHPEWLFNNIIRINAGAGCRMTSPSNNDDIRSL